MNNHWYDTINKGLLIGCVAMDLHKAFNVLNHEILMEGTEIIYRCYESAVIWFTS